MTLLDEALARAGEGFRVFPLIPNGKTPALETDWRKIATGDPEKIRRLWTDPATGWDQPYNIGIATGDGVVVIDVDMKDGKDGESGLRLLQVLNDELPATREAMTPTGGRHLYFDTDAPIGNSGSRLAEGVDVRGEGGFVVAPGSIIDGIPYVWATTAPRARLPQWLAAMAGPPAPRKERGEPIVDEDDPAAIARAIAWLREKAPDHGTYAVAARVKDFGVSEPMCGEIMLEHWRDARNLGKGDEHVLFRVANAYRYGQNPVGIASPEAEFEPVEVGEQTKPSGDLNPLRLSQADMKAVKPREWLYGDKLLRRYVSMLVSPGGVGKTAWTTTAALACASGEVLLHDKPHHPMTVWVYNLEDDIEEVKRRFWAAAEYYGVKTDACDRVLVMSGRDRGLKLMRMQGDQFMVLPDKAKLIATMLRESVEVLVIDPFIYSHDLPENSTEAMGAALKQFAEIAQATNAAILLLHHTRKGAEAGDPDSVRGSSAQVGGARKVLTMAKMSEDEARKLCIRSEDRRLYVRIDGGKENMSPPAASAEWMKLGSVNLDNATPDYPKGDSVQVARRWTPPDPMVGVTDDMIEDCLAAIEDGLENGERYSRLRTSPERYVVPLIAAKLDRDERQAEQILKTWLEKGVVEERSYLSPSQRKDRKGLFRIKGDII